MAEQIAVHDAGTAACRHALALVIGLDDAGMGDGGNGSDEGSDEGSRAAHDASTYDKTRSPRSPVADVDLDALLAGARLCENGVPEDADFDEIGAGSGNSGNSGNSGAEKILIAAARQRSSPFAAKVLDRVLDGIVGVQWHRDLFGDPVRFRQRQRHHPPTHVPPTHPSTVPPTHPPANANANAAITVPHLVIYLALLGIVR